MKKQIVAVLAGALMTLAASSAFAAFGDMQLLRVVYDTDSTKEMLTDLGSINSLKTLTADLTVGADYRTVLGQSDYSKLQVAYFASDAAEFENTWVAGMYLSSTSSMTQNNPGSSTVPTGSIPTIGSYYNSLSTKTTAADGTTSAIGSQTNSKSYTVKMGGVNAGSFGSGIENFTGEQNLAALASSSSLATMVLYWADADTASTGVKTFDILTNANGTTTIKAAAAAPVPLPAAAYLLGSGLLGLVGVRRKANKG